MLPTLASATTPMISTSLVVGPEAICIRWPTTSPDADNFFASVSFTMATLGAVSLSAHVKSRPRSCAIEYRSKKPGLT